MTKQTDLISYLFDGKAHPLSTQLARWMEESARFTVFVETYRDKIRKKIRLTREPEPALDLGSELEVAFSLLSDRRLAVDYEPYASAKRRGPDFAVTYRANLVFNIEVARMRADENGVPELDSPRWDERFLRILLYKLGQMQAGKPNLLVICTRKELARSIDLGGLMQGLKTRVEGKDPAFYNISRYENPAAFYKDFSHLTGILLWAASPETQLWVNKQARPTLAVEVLRLTSSLASNTLPPPAHS